MESTAVIDITAMDKELIELNEMIKPVPDILGQVETSRAEQTKIRNQIKVLSKQESDLNGTITTIKQTIQSLESC